ncbi:epoxide hydrolase family protein [Nonomuraea sediminis]|uniref:epoxide hydrolase family protein n=1 Tax=Nonomuraea sediminis TaxID=2835864 RepID=UPI001BDD5A05|nr:epoxide hydrolase family protein [Nonomuraea sediminis]
MSEIQPFHIDVPDADLDDLRDRLRRTRFTGELPPGQDPWEYGVPVDYVRDLVEHWRDGFDWRAVEARLNAYPQFTTEIDGQTIHFLHVRSPQAGAIPLILTHGWPNTFVEYVGLIAELTAGGFDVVIPSLPGFAFSGPTRERGWNAERTAAAWGELMRRLGYDRYGVHGNDAGAIVAPIQGRLSREHVIGVHVTQIFSFPSGDPGEMEGISPEDLQYLQFLQSFVSHAVHDKVQEEQPQTIAHALADSPAGQLAWSGQLFGDALSKDDILTNATIYWITNTAASAARFYYENKRMKPDTEPTTVPMGLASFAYDFRPLRRFAERDHANIVSWNEYDRGSHWSAHDAPDLLVADIMEFFRELR